MPKVVFSSTTATVDWNTRLVTGDAVTLLHRPGQLGEPAPGRGPAVLRRRGADHVRDQALSARRASRHQGPRRTAAARQQLFQAPAPWPE
jgi:hypothetical protein